MTKSQFRDAVLLAALLLLCLGVALWRGQKPEQEKAETTRLRERIESIPAVTDSSVARTRRKLPSSRSEARKKRKSKRKARESKPAQREKLPPRDHLDEEVPGQ